MSTIPVIPFAPDVDNFQNKSPAGRGRRSVPHPAGLLNVSMVLFIFLYFYSRRRYAHSCIFIS